MAAPEVNKVEISHEPELNSFKIEFTVDGKIEKAYFAYGALYQALMIDALGKYRYSDLSHSLYKPKNLASSSS